VFGVISVIPGWATSALMKLFLSLSALVGLLVSVSAHAQPTIATLSCGEGVAVAGATQVAACLEKRSAQTSAASQASAQQPMVPSSASNIPSECSSCPLVATCYPT
jgi:hypothetical protein